MFRCRNHVLNLFEDKHLFTSIGNNITYIETDKNSVTQIQYTYTN